MSAHAGSVEDYVGFRVRLKHDHPDNKGIYPTIGPRVGVITVSYRVPSGKYAGAHGLFVEWDDPPFLLRGVSIDQFEIVRS